jgi:hypothetical protein
MRSRVSAYIRQHRLALLCLFLILGGGSAYAVNGRPRRRRAPESARGGCGRSPRAPRVATGQGEPLRQDRRRRRPGDGRRSDGEPARADPGGGLAVRKPCLTCGTLTEGSYRRVHQRWRPRGRHNARLRARVFRAHGRPCRDCGRADLPLEVHHVNGDPSDNRIMNTIPLCRDCHHEATFPGI